MRWEERKEKWFVEPNKSSITYKRPHVEVNQADLVDTKEGLKWTLEVTTHVSLPCVLHVVTTFPKFSYFSFKSILDLESFVLVLKVLIILN